MFPVNKPNPLFFVGVSSGHRDFNEEGTAFDALPTHRPPNRVSMSVPIVLPCTGFTKESLEASGMTSAALVTKVRTDPPALLLYGPDAAAWWCVARMVQQAEVPKERHVTTHLRVAPGVEVLASA